MGGYEGGGDAVPSESDRAVRRGGLY